MHNVRKLNSNRNRNTYFLDIFLIFSQKMNGKVIKKLCINKRFNNKKYHQCLIGGSRVDVQLVRGFF